MFSGTYFTSRVSTPMIIFSVVVRHKVNNEWKKYVLYKCLSP